MRYSSPSAGKKAHSRYKKKKKRERSYFNPSDRADHLKAMAATKKAAGHWPSRKPGPSLSKALSLAGSRFGDKRKSVGSRRI